MGFEWYLLFAGVGGWTLFLILLQFVRGQTVHGLWTYLLLVCTLGAIFTWPGLTT